MGRLTSIASAIKFKYGVNMYYNYDKVISYNALLNFLIGERGVR